MKSTGARLAAVLAALGALRLALIGLTDVIPDEAYYAIWADHLAPCYWDQPGGIAIWNALVTALFGRSAFSLRLGAVILSWITSFFAYDLGKTTLRDARAAAAGVLLMQIVPLLSMGAVLILHDTLMGAALTATLAFMARAVLREKTAWWYAAAAAGTIALYAKFSAAIVVGGFALFAVLSDQGRRALRNVDLYIAGFAVAVLFSPVIAWNARHGWVAYYAVTKLSSDASITPLGRAASVLDFLGSQAALVTPILLVLMGFSAVGVLRARKKDRNDGRLFLVAMTLGFFTYFAAQALRAKVQGNWAAPAYVPGCLLVADWMLARRGKGRAWTWSKAGVALAGVATVLIHTQAAYPFLPIPASIDLSAQARGWRHLADQVSGYLAESDPGTAVLARRYQVASELRFYLPSDVDVFCANYASRGHQFDLWQSFDKLAGRDVIYVDFQDRSAKLFLHFSGERELPSVKLGLGRKGDRTLNLWRLNHFTTRGPLQSYFRKPFDDSLERLHLRIETGRDG